MDFYKWLKTMFMQISLETKMIDTMAIHAHKFILETYCWNAGFWADFPSYVKFK